MTKYMKLTILILIFLALGIYSVFIEPNRLVITHYTIPNQELHGIKIAFPSDIHIRPHQGKKLARIVKLVNEQKPDIILSAGDFVSGHTKRSTMPIEDIAKGLSKMKSKYGIYTVLGNHDGWYGNARITKALEQNGISVLENENLKLNINGKTVYLAGVEDMMTGNPDIEKALNNTKAPTILLSHTPDIFPLIEENVDLVLAGHTHGGQIRIPLIGPIFTASRYHDKYAKGLIEENGQKMIVSTGIGESILPIRFNCPPEIVIIEFE